MSSVRTVVIASIIISFCTGQYGNLCSVEPKDLYTEVGSSVEIICQSSCVKDNIFWTLNNKRVSESLSRSINSTHTVLSMRSFTHPSATLECHSSRSGQILGGTTIRTYTKPKILSCEWHHESHDPGGVPPCFTCRWDHQRDDPALKITYTVQLNSSEKPDLTDICSSQTTTCTFKGIDLSDDIDFGKSYTVAVRAKTDVWEAYSDPFEFYSNHIIKINPPADVSVTAFSDHLSVKWTLWGEMELKYRCQVKYNKASLSDDETPKLISITSQVRTANITDVESCINYSVSVRCAVEEALWSEWSPARTVLTKLNKSHIRLRLWRKVTEKGESGKRNVRLMWMATPPACEEPFCYTAKQTSYPEQNTTEGSYTSCVDSACDVEVDQRAHRLYLMVSTHEGLLTEESVHVPAVGERLPQVTDIQTITHKGVVEVSWRAPVELIRGYVLDWTTDGNQYDWKESTSNYATLTGLADRTLYDITVTPLLEDRTGHSTQALQICSSTGVPETLDIGDVQVYDTSAVVNWDTKSKDACSAAVAFTVFFKTHGGPLHNVTVAGVQRKATLKDLKPNRQYSISVEAKGHDGNTTSKQITITTAAFDPRFITALSVCGSIFLLLILFLGLCCAIQWKKFKKKPVPNPGLSSVAKWLSQNHPKRVWFFQSLTNQSENLCDQVYTEETQRAYAPPPTLICDDDEEAGDPSTTFLSYSQNDQSSETTETQLLSSPDKTISGLFSESNPYRSQSSAETSLSKTENQCQCDSGKQQDKSTTKSVYVSLNMFEHDNV